MSLILTSNEGSELDSANNSGAFTAFAYQNRLLNTLRIPADSEIAVQSVKINRPQEILANSANSRFGHFFGPNLAKNATNLEDTTMPIFRGEIAGLEESDGNPKAFNIDGFAKAVETGFKNQTWHPSMVTSSVVGGIDVIDRSVTVDTVYDPADATKWLGYDWQFTQTAAANTNKTADFKFVDISQDLTNQGTAIGTTVSTTSETGFQVQARSRPISQNNGSCIIDFNGANASSDNNTWIAGLSRINTQKTNGTTIPNKYFTHDTPQFTTCGGKCYCDIAVVRDATDGLLRVFQSSTKGNAGIKFMSEVIYYGSWNANFATQYDIQTNAKKYQKVEFVLDNEHILIWLVNDVGAKTLLADYGTLQAAGAIKNQCLNPTNCAKWAMYPVMATRVKSSGVSSSMVLESLTHYPAYPEYNAAEYHKWDWWGSCENGGGILLNSATKLENRPWNRSDTATLLAPLVLNVAKGMKDYEHQVITQKLGPEGSEAAISTKGFESAELYGFKNFPSSEKGTGTDLITNIQSASVPTENGNTQSLFVRLNNFTQQSMNARMGTISNIVAHLPRFDTAGRDTGPMYFEPSERTYLDLNNPSEMVVNDFDVDFVYENERQARNLVGKTVVMFHIRKKLA